MLSIDLADPQRAAGTVGAASIVCHTHCGQPVDEWWRTVSEVHPPYPALTIANWFLAWSEGDDEAGVSNLKLQKLLYYAQGAALAKWGEPVIKEPIEAWSHGPVVANVYHHFKTSGSAPLQADDSFDWDQVDNKTGSLLVSVWNTWGGYSAWKLRELTHREAPWRDAFDMDIRSNAISNEAIQRYFSTLSPGVAK